MAALLYPTSSDWVRGAQATQVLSHDITVVSPSCHLGLTWHGSCVCSQELPCGERLPGNKAKRKQGKVRVGVSEKSEVGGYVPVI